MDGFERRRERKKEAIRQSAFDLFSKYGIQKTSIEEIAGKANVSQVTIYNYFGSKDELTLDVIKTFTERIFAEYVKTLDSELPFREKLEWIIEREMNVAETLSHDFIVSIMEDSPEIQAYYQQFTEETAMPFMIKLVDEGKAAGYIDHNLSHEMILFYINMYYRELMRHPELYNDEKKKTQFTKETLQLFFYGLMGKERR